MRPKNFIIIIIIIITVSPCFACELRLFFASFPGGQRALPSPPTVRAGIQAGDGPRKSPVSGGFSLSIRILYPAEYKYKYYTHCFSPLKVTCGAVATHRFYPCMMRAACIIRTLIFDHNLKKKEEKITKKTEGLSLQTYIY